MSSAAAAQESLTLDAAVQAALAHNPTLAGARAAVRQAQAGVTEARSTYFPRVSFSDSWQRGNGPVFAFGSLLSARRFGANDFAIDALNHPDAIGYFHGMFGVEQLIFDGGRQQAGVDAAHQRTAMAEAGADGASADLALQTTEVFGRLLAAQAAQQTAEAAVKAAGEDAARAAHRRDAGTATDADVLAVQVHLADMRQRAIQASADAATLRAQLNRLMGAPIEQDYVAQEPPLADAASADVSTLLSEADAARPDLRRAEAAARLANAGVREARAGWFPQLVAQAGYELDGTSFADRASAWVVGGGLRWSLSAGGAEAARTRAAAEEAVRARAAADDARAAVHVDVISALRRLEAARAREAVGRAAVDQARESQRIIRDRYDAGMAGVTDVLRAATAVLDAEAQRVAALVDAVTSQAMLRHAIGRAP
ncbi:MAG: TolC family protein [Betaproteobacteria bacterium]